MINNLEYFLRKPLLKLRNFWILFLLTLIAGSAVRAQADRSREEELSYLRVAVAPDLIPYAHIEIPAMENIRIREGGEGRSLGLRTYHGQKLKNNGIRAEVTVDYPTREGETVTYSWRFLIDKDFPSDAPENRWWLFGSWHDQPNRNRGEGWEGFPSHSPPIAIGYGFLNGADQLALTYGSPDSTTVGLVPFTRGVWHKVTVRIVWSRGAKGRAELRLDDSPTAVVAGSGPNMHNDFQHYLKVGMYRHREIRGDNWIYLRDIAVKKAVAK